MKTVRATPSRKPAPEQLRAFSRSLPMALLRAREAVMARFRPMLREHDLTEQQWRVLRALESAAAPLRAGEIGEQTFVSMPSLSRLLRTLEARELVRRTVHADDLRAAQIVLSPRGKRLIAKLGPLSESHYEEITDVVGAEDLEQLYRLLDAVRTKLTNADASEDSTGSIKA